MLFRMETLTGVKGLSPRYLLSLLVPRDLVEPTNRLGGHRFPPNEYSEPRHVSPYRNNSIETLLHGDDECSFAIIVDHGYCLRVSVDIHIERLCWGRQGLGWKKPVKSNALKPTTSFFHSAAIINAVFRWKS